MVGVKNEKRIPELGVNIDHVATIRQARGTSYPEPSRAGELAQSAGADSITVHLREDRRHIQEADVVELKGCLSVPLNLEMALVDEFVEFALEIKPEKICLVPERREELTTEGGLNVVKFFDSISPTCDRFAESGIEVSLFVEADLDQIEAAKKTGAPVIEIHTGAYADAVGEAQAAELERICQASAHAEQLGLVVNAGHGLHLLNVAPIARINNIRELNIGHSLVADALFVGLAEAVQRMKAAIAAAFESA